MPNEQIMLSKGYYRHSQINGFVTVKNYIYIKQNGKKCLLLRFFNETDFEIDRIEFTVIQLDASGNTLGEVRMQEDGLRFVAGGYYTCHDSIVMREGCHDFRVVMNEVISRDFRYCVRDGEVTAYYLKEQKALLNMPKRAKRARKKEEFSVRTKHFEDSRAAVVLAVIAALLFVAMSVLRFVLPKDTPRDGKTAKAQLSVGMTVDLKSISNNQFFGA